MYYKTTLKLLWVVLINLLRVSLVINNLCAYLWSTVVDVTTCTHGEGMKTMRQARNQNDTSRARFSWEINRVSVACEGATNFPPRGSNLASRSFKRSNKFLAYYLGSSGTSHSANSYLGIANDWWTHVYAQTLRFLDANAAFILLR